MYLHTKTHRCKIQDSLGLVSDDSVGTNLADRTHASSCSSACERGCRKVDEEGLVRPQLFRAAAVPP